MLFGELKNKEIELKENKFMFNKIKEYFRAKKERKDLLYAAVITLINDSSDFYRAQTESLEATKKMNETVSPEDLKTFMQNMGEFVSNPQLSEKFYEQIAEYSQKDKVTKVN